MKASRSAALLLLSGLGLYGMSSCGPAPVTLDSLPVPPFVKEGNYNGGFETRVDVQLSGVRDQVRERHGPVEVSDFGLVEKGKTFDDILAFYAQPEIERALSSAGFVRQPESGNSDRMASWTRKRTFGKDELLAVFYSPGFEGDPLNFMVRMHAPRQKQ